MKIIDAFGQGSSDQAPLETLEYDIGSEAAFAVKIRR